MGKCLISQVCYKNKYIKNYKIPQNTVVCVRCILQIGGKKSLKQNSVYFQILISPVSEGHTADHQLTHFCNSRECQHLCADCSSFTVSGLNLWGFSADLGVDNDAPGAAGCSRSTTVLPPLGPGGGLPTLTGMGCSQHLRCRLLLENHLWWPTETSPGCLWSLGSHGRLGDLYVPPIPGDKSSSKSVQQHTYVRHVVFCSIISLFPEYPVEVKSSRIFLSLQFSLPIH